MISDEDDLPEEPKVLLCWACEHGRPDDCSGWCGLILKGSDVYGPVDWRGWERELEAGLFD